MKKNSILILGSILCFICLFACNSNQQTEEAYVNMPPELANIYKKINKNPSNAALYVELSDYYAKTSTLDSALNTILTALRLDSNNANYYLKLSDIYFAMQNIDASEEILEKVIAIDRTNKEAYLKLAELHFLHKRYKEARKCLDDVLLIDNYNPKAYFIRAWVYKEEGDTNAAIRSYMAAVEQDPNYFEAYEDLGVLYHHKKDPLAISYYKNALNIKPDNIQVLYNLAMFYQETGDFEKALQQYKMILQLNPTYTYALHNIGWIYMIEQQKYDEAIAFFTKAIESDTSYIEAIYNRGVAFESLKKYNNARQDYAYVLKLNDTYELAIQGLNRLDKLQNK